MGFFSYIALGAWLSGVGVGFFLGQRKMPAVVLILGMIVLALTWQGLLLDALGMAALAVLAALMWIVNKAALA